MKSIFILILVLLNLFTIEVKSEMLVLDKLERPGKTSQDQNWSFETDGVMGGLSEGNVKLEKIDNVLCYRMRGNVTTENNGGFIQIRTFLKPLIKIKNFKGIYLKVYGNNKNYFLHARTPLTVAPWQYYSYGFKASENWTEIKAPFINFKKSNFYQPNKLETQSMKSIAIVAAFKNFKADICISEIGFY